MSTYWVRTREKSAADSRLPPTDVGAQVHGGAAQMGEGRFEADACAQGRFLEQQSLHVARKPRFPDALRVRLLERRGPFEDRLDLGRSKGQTG